MDRKGVILKLSDINACGHFLIGLTVSLETGKEFHMDTNAEQEKDTLEVPEGYFSEKDEETQNEVDSSEFTDFTMNYSDIEKEEKKKEQKKKQHLDKGRQVKFSLLYRITAIVTVPMIILILFFSLFLMLSTERLTKPYAKDQLNALTSSVTEAFAVASRGDFHLQNGVLMKGESELSLVQDFMDEMANRSGNVLSVYYGDTCVMTSVNPETKERAGKSAIPEKAYEQVKAGNYYFDSKAKTDGEEAYVYYYPLMQESSGEVIGSVSCTMSRQAIKKAAGANQRQMYLFCTFLALIGVVVSFFEIRNMVRCLNQSKQNLELVARGELVLRVRRNALSRKDEIGGIANSVSDMVKSLTKLIKEISGSEKDVETYSVQLNNSMKKISETVESVNLAIEEIAKGATSQATETMQANTQVAQIGDSIEATVTEVDSLSQSALKMNEFSISADKTLQELLMISKESDDAINEIRRQTIETNESAQQIQIATDMITEISGQTNLLSLNASIEAARAGEAGKGFAVVADEIRQLAEQSKKSADRIREIIEDLIGKSNVSVKTMNGVAQSINVQNNKLDETLHVFTELSSEISLVMKSVRGISAQTKSLTSLRNGVVGIVEGLAAIAEENAAGAEETSASMYEVNTIVEECRKQTEQLMLVKNKLAENAEKFKME